VIGLVVQVRLGQLLVDTVHAHNAAAELGVPQPSTSTASPASPPAALRCYWSDDGVPTVTAVGDTAVEAGAAGGEGDEDLGTCVVVARATTIVRGNEGGGGGGRTAGSTSTATEVPGEGARARGAGAGGEVRAAVAQGEVAGRAEVRSDNANNAEVFVGMATAVRGEGNSPNEGGGEAAAAAHDRETQETVVQPVDSRDVGTAGGAAAAAVGVVGVGGVTTGAAAKKKRRKADRWLEELQTGGEESSQAKKKAKKKAAPEDAIDDIFAMLGKGQKGKA